MSWACTCYNVQHRGSACPSFQSSIQWKCLEARTIAYTNLTDDLWMGIDIGNLTKLVMETGWRGEGGRLNCKLFLALSFLTPGTPSLSLLLLHSPGEQMEVENDRCLTLLNAVAPSTSSHWTSGLSMLKHMIYNQDAVKDTPCLLAWWQWYKKCKC